MKILVCMKKILADESDIFIDRNQIERNCLLYKLNQADIRAFLEGTTLKENHPGSVLDVVTVDGSGSEPFLKLLTAYGGDQGYRLWDNSLEEQAELNNLQLAEILSSFVQKQEYDIILFGNQSEYFGAGGLPLLLGCKLGIPAITDITQVDHIGEGMVIHRMLEKGRRVVYQCNSQVVLSFDRGVSLRLADDIDKLIKSQDVAINFVSFSQLGMESGLVARSVEKVDYSYPKPRTKYVLIPETDSVEDRLGFLMGGGGAKKTAAATGPVEGKSDRVADEICKALAQRNVIALP